MKKIKVCRKTTEYEIILDDEDYNTIKNLSLSVTFNLNSIKYDIPKVMANGKSLHRFIVKSTANQICIHKNHNTLDFRKDNLFITTQKELYDLVRNGTVKQSFDSLGRVYYDF